MDARLGAMIEKEGDDDYDLVSAIYEANVASTPRCCARWRPELVGRSVRGLPDALAACDAVQIVESAGPYVSVRYDRVMNGLEQATQIPQKACAAHGKTAQLRKTYYEGLCLSRQLYRARIESQNSPRVMALQRHLATVR